MISGKSSASGRLGALAPTFRGPQIGIGYYESVGSDYFVDSPSPAQVAAQRLPQVVASPAPGSAAPLPKPPAAAMSGFAVVGLIAAGCAAAWAGSKTVGYLRRTA